MCFSESERDPGHMSLIGKKILKKVCGNGKCIRELKAEFLYLSACEREKKQL